MKVGMKPALLILFCVLRPSTANRCTCRNGVAATGRRCPNNGARSCASCNEGFHLADTQGSRGSGGTSRVCKAKQCTCRDGVGATGTSCPEDGRPGCASCNHGFHLRDGACARGGAVTYPAGTKVCTCKNGAGVVGRSCSANGAEMCASCNPGFNLQRGTNLCAANRCTCRDGVGATGIGCSRDGDDACVTCNDGYYYYVRHGRNPVCEARQCTCRDGVGATGTSCREDGRKHCVSCNAGYHLKAGNPPHCKANRCKCRHGVGATGIGCGHNGGKSCIACDHGFTFKYTVTKQGGRSVACSRADVVVVHGRNLRGEVDE